MMRYLDSVGSSSLEVWHLFNKLESNSCLMTLNKKLICITPIGSVHEQYQMGVRLDGYT
jgi:hypothetical protein